VTVILAHLHLKVQQLSRGGGQEIAGGNGSRGIDFKWFQLMIFHGSQYFYLICFWIKENLSLVVPINNFKYFDILYLIFQYIFDNILRKITFKLI